MVPVRTRRRLLGTLAAVSVGPFAACAGRSSSEAGTSPSADEPTATSESEPSPTATRERTSEPRSGPDSFYVENHGGEAYCLSLSVTNEETGEAPLDGTYSVGSRTGIEFPNVGQVGETYAVTATVGRDDTVDTTWHVAPCAPAFRGGGSDRAGGLYVGDDSFFFATNQCDVMSFGDAELPYSLAPSESDCEKETATTR